MYIYYIYIHNVGTVQATDLPIPLVLLCAPGIDLGPRNFDFPGLVSQLVLVVFLDHHPLVKVAGLWDLLVLSREWMGMGEWGNGIIMNITDHSLIPYVSHQ